MPSGLPPATCSQCGTAVRLTARFCPVCGTALTVGAVHGAFVPGAVLDAHGRYRIASVLGKGGFGEAYLAHDTQLDRPCVVKRLVLNPGWSRADQRMVATNFAREARLLVTLNTPGHPSIPDIYEYLPDRQCLVMKYITGESLEQRVRARGPLLETEALHYVRDVCAALGYMHARAEPVLHRDVKPANILLDATGRVWLIDFGLARANVLTHERAVAGQSLSAGTPGYTPPEQWRGQAEPRSDIFALGATLHALLTGYRATASALAGLMRGERLPSVRTLATSVRPEVEQLVERMTAFAPADRPDAAELLATLETLIHRPTIDPPPAPTRPPETATLVGRDALLDEYAATLHTDGLALITGPAGVGKTALAAELAHRTNEHNRIFWHTCHADAGGDVLVWALAGFLAHHERADVWRQLQTARQSGTPPPPPDTLGDYLVQELRADDARGLTLCLDDLHLVDDDPLVGRLFAKLRDAAGAGRVQLIVTARRVPPFVRERVRPLVGLDAMAASALLVARGATFPFGLLSSLVDATGGNAQLLLLAAETLQHAVDPQHLLDQLRKHDDIERYLLREVDAGLRSDERAVMGALAVLLDYGGTRDAIEAVRDGNSVRPILSDLHARGLLSVQTSDDQTTYRQHAIIQSFYYAQLSRRERHTLHQRAATFYEHDEPDLLQAARHYQRAGKHERAANLATTDVDSAINRGQARALERLLAHLPVAQLAPLLRAAVATARGEVAALLGDYPLARTQFEQALADGATLTASAAQIEAQARRRRLLGLVGERTGQYADAEANCRNGLTLALPLGLPNLEVARLYAQLAEVLLRRSEYDHAAKACRDGLAALPPEPAAPRERAMLLQRLATTDGERGHYAQAITELEHSLALAQQSSDFGLIALVLHNVGSYHFVVGQHEAARRCYQESLYLKEQIGDTSGRITTINNLGTLYLAEGDADAALRSFEECRSLAERLGLSDVLALAQRSIGQLHFEQGHFPAAEDRLRQSYTLYTQMSNATDAAWSLYLLGDVALAQHDVPTAHECARTALVLARQSGSPTREASALRVLGEVLLVQGYLAEAAEHLAQAWALQEQIGDPYDEAFLLAARAKLAQAQGNLAEALVLAHQGLTLAREQHVPYLVRVLEQRVEMLEAIQRVSEAR